MLRVTNLEAGYGSQTVLRGLTFDVPRGRVVALLGGNGAGKTTTLNTIMGLIYPQAGSIELNGERIENEPPHRVFGRGLSLVPQWRELFPEMTAAENLELGAVERRPQRDYRERLDGVLGYFPELRSQLAKPAGALSGGQQQMLATARALMSDPDLLLLDEPSMGLAPRIVNELGRTVGRLSSEGKTVLLVEQNINLALSVAHYIYVIRNGIIVAQGERPQFDDRDALFRSYIG